MIYLEPLTYIKGHLDIIAKERNKTLISLRSDWITEEFKQDKWILNINPDKERYFYVNIIDPFTNKQRLIGYGGLDKINHINQTAELSLMIFQDYQKNGLGKKTVKRLLNYGFNNLNLNCIFIEVYDTTYNWSFWEKCGFQKEGVLKQRKKWDGRFFDSYVGSVLKGNDA